MSTSQNPSPDVPPATSSTPDEGTSFILYPSIVERLAWDRTFGNLQPVELEIGAGDGSFLVHYAAKHPERNFLGIERLLGRMRKIDRKSKKLGLLNVRALRLEASYVLRWMIPPGSLSAIHVYFPDPWPKRRHWKRRLITPEFTELAHRALAPGGVVYLRTDHAEYFVQMQEVFTPSPLFAACVAPEELLSVWTDFETDFRARGIVTLQSAWIARPN